MDFIQEFKRIFGTKPVLKSAAPGRVNLIGEHTDYNDGYVMPIAIQYAVTVLSRPRSDSKIRLYSADFGQMTSFDLTASLVKDTQFRWSDYEKGVVSEFLKAGHSLNGADLLVYGNVPVASGLSSSAAVEVAAATAFRAMNRIKMTDVELVKLCQRAENNFVGMKCGIMDQFISGIGKAGSALFLDCRTLEYKIVPFPSDLYSVVILNTKKKRELTGSEYNERRSQCEEGVRLLSVGLPGIKALRDVTIEDFQTHSDGLSDLIRKRCLHVISENNRVLDFVDALRNTDEKAIGRLLVASHESLRDLYEVSCAELDLMVELSMSVSGVIGARMTGAGFGGCAIAVVKKGTEDALKAKILDAYPMKTGIQPEIYVSSPSDGARAENLD
jgi:galactokinase